VKSSRCARVLQAAPKAPAQRAAQRSDLTRIRDRAWWRASFTQGGTDVARIKTGALIISWDSIIPGREARTLPVFGKVLAYAKRLEEEKRISGSQVFVPMTLPNRDTILLYGDTEALAMLLVDDEFEALMVEGQLVVRNLHVGLLAGGTPESLAGGLAMNQELMTQHGLA
jgi:hypothetical protein